MKNHEKASSSTQPNQRLSSPSHLRLTAHSYEREGYHPESKQRYTSPPPQSTKRLKDCKPSPPRIPVVLPQDIVGDIMSNLPAKSLIRFRSVSHSLNSLVSDPLFIKKHLKKALDDPEFTKSRVFTNVVSDRLSMKSCSLNAIYNDPVVNPVEVESVTDYTSRFGNWVVGSCNGLMCIAVKKETVFLMNPTLRVIKTLPDFGIRKRRCSHNVFGFGYDASRDDYKVVNVFCYLSKGMYFETIVNVYSLRTDSWRRIEDFPYGAPCDEHGKFVDGCLNWTVYHEGEGDSPWMIVSLDLAEETYKEVQQPNYENGVSEIILGILDGCLCMLCNYENVHFDVWIMREYRKTESWTKLATFPLLEELGSEWSPTPLFLSSSGEILLLMGFRLVLYNPTQKSWRTPMIDADAAAAYVDQAEIYVESLVSPIIVDQH